jgi:Ca-activated chloride channel family protein
VVLVVSDGEDQEQGALQVVKKMSEEGIKVYSIAYGTEKGAAIPVMDRFGNAVGFKKDDSGQTILTQVRGDFLKKLAEAGGGNFYFAQFDGDHLKRFVNDLADLEKTQFQSSINTQYEEKFTFPLLIGVVLLFISFLIHDRNALLANWKGRYET